MMKRHCAKTPFKKSLKGNAIGLNMLGMGKMSSLKSAAVLYNPVQNSDCYSVSQRQEGMVRDRVFQHAALLQKNIQRNDSMLCLQMEELLKKNKKCLVEPAVVLSSDEETLACSGTSANSGSSITSGDTEQVVGDFLTSHFFADNKTRPPKRKQMKNMLGKLGRKVKKNHPTLPSESTSPRVSEAISVVCRCVRVGTMDRKPSNVTFTTEYIQIDEQVQLRSSILSSCSWCTHQSMPALFLTTTQGEAQRLRVLLNMSRTQSGWYDCKGQHFGERYIILVFKNNISKLEEVGLQKIFREIGRRNEADPEDFTIQLSFTEAINILVESSQPAPEKTDDAPCAKTSRANNRHADKQLFEFIHGESMPTTPKSLISKRLTFTPPRITPVGPSLATLVQSPAPSPLSPAPMCPPSPSRCTFQAPTQVLDDEEIMEIESTFTGQVKRLILYPPPPAKGGISVTNEDLHRLNEGEFLNDVIIDFYLKYLVSAVLNEADASKTHIFSSFFYKQLTQTEQGKTPGSVDLPVKTRRHNRVRKWTRNVDLFQKDFIFVPINESAHWFLAVICFPGLVDSPPAPSPPAPSPPWEVEAGSCLDTSFLMDWNSPNPMSLFFRPPHSSARDPTDSPPADWGLTLGVSLSLCSDEEGGAELLSEFSGSSSSRMGLSGWMKTKRQRVSDNFIRSEMENDVYAFSPDEDFKQCDEGKLQGSGDVSSLTSIRRRPCIMIMDSLRGSSRAAVMSVLQEYLEVEWEVRRGSLRRFSRDTIQGLNPAVPQQDNFSDCGVFLLQYVESFLQNPPQDIEHLDLKEWFPLKRVKRKREEIRKLVLEIQRQQEKKTEDSQPVT
ncbi:hypothetical protein UPYG_G00226820 [Umbra pygmaea]|uniref:Ubiquitin-like protease family profile domain-containing protein n=1 Tax=Umbra pygmaea TaxID=75934 RepID=A0ABD0WCM6_UMBPY